MTALSWVRQTPELNGAWQHQLPNSLQEGCGRKETCPALPPSLQLASVSSSLYLGIWGGWGCSLVCTPGSSICANTCAQACAGVSCCMIRRSSLQNGDEYQAWGLWQCP